VVTSHRDSAIESKAAGEPYDEYVQKGIERILSAEKAIAGVD